MDVRSYRDLTVWQTAMAIATEVYRLTENFPKRETYGLVSQMRRAAVSIVSNIAEGHARESTKEYLHHVSFARGSLAELETQTLLSVELGYATQEGTGAVLKACDELGRMLRTLQDSLRRRVLSPQSLIPSP